MRTSFTILSLFLIASFAIIFANRPVRYKVKTREERMDLSIPVTSVEWIDSTKNFEKVLEGTLVNVEFRFRNTGGKMLVISDVAASCGCTIPEKPEKPISPGEVGIIKARFDSKNRVGTNHKVLTVYVNTEERAKDLSFDVEVIPVK